VQEQQQGAAADEVDDDERRQRAERVRVVRAREAPGTPQRVADSATLEERRRNCEPGEGEPCERGQDEDPDEEANRQKDDDANREGGQQRPAWRTLP
jgi:hypothetical protein